jgi:hypothetical protein
VAPGGKNRSNIPSHPAGAWVSRQGAPKARNRLFPTWHSSRPGGSYRTSVLGGGVRPWR